MALASALPGAPIILSLEQAVAYELAQPRGGHWFADPGAPGELAEGRGAGEGLAKDQQRERLPVTSSALATLPPIGPPVQRSGRHAVRGIPRTITVALTASPRRSSRELPRRARAANDNMALTAWWAPCWAG